MQTFGLRIINSRSRAKNVHNLWNSCWNEHNQTVFIKHFEFATQTKCFFASSRFLAILHTWKTLVKISRNRKFNWEMCLIYNQWWDKLRWIFIFLRNSIVAIIKFRPSFSHLSMMNQYLSPTKSKLSWLSFAVAILCTVVNMKIEVQIQLEERSKSTRSTGCLIIIIRWPLQKNIFIS